MKISQNDRGGANSFEPETILCYLGNKAFITVTVRELLFSHIAVKL